MEQARPGVLPAFLLPFRCVDVCEADLVGRAPVDQGQGVAVLDLGDDAGDLGGSRSGSEERCKNYCYIG